MEKEVEENYIKAGKIASKVREYACSLVQPSAFVLDIVEKIEQRVEALGGMPAFYKRHSGALASRIQ